MRAVLFLKAHVKGYARKDGTYVRAHERKGGASSDAHEVGSGAAQDNDGLLRNVIGGLEPRASVMGMGGSWGNYSHYIVHSMSTKVNGRSFPTIDDAETALTNDGWQVVERGFDGYNKPRITVEHTATARAIRSIAERAANKWRDAKPVFVRYGKLPPGGRSRNYTDNFLEAGVSVYHGEALPSGEARVIPKNTTQDYGAKNYAAHGAQLFIVHGDIIGVGSDGEPLLANVKIIRRAK